MIVFKCAVGEYNVFKVNGVASESCTVGPESDALFTESDPIVLAMPGRKCYISGVVHCNVGHKLVITVQLDTLSPSPSPV
ncbi:hypothetical protein CR513_43315, partial [Mucuna pruriens]